MSELSQNIRLLGGLLGKTIKAQAGESVFNTEENIRSLSKSVREGDTDANRDVGKIVWQLVQDLPHTTEIVKAFSTYFQLINLAEEHERIRILRQRANTAFQNQEPMDESIEAAIEVLKREGLTPSQIQATLKQMLIMPVFTAHPTESRRRTIRQILHEISDCLHSLGRELDFEQGEIKQQISRYITLLWQSDESRKRRPTVMDEVRNTGLYFFENTLFDVVPQIYAELERALGTAYPDFDWDVPCILRFGSWIGGDRDGNPFVTKETTESAIRAHKQVALERYAADTITLYEMLSPSLSRSGFSKELLDDLQEGMKVLPDDALENVSRFDQEPYRQKLILMYRRIHATINQNKESWNSGIQNPRAYKSSEELLADLSLIDRSLKDNQGGLLAQGRLRDLIRRVHVFGFHLASLDIRQHSRRHESAIDEVTKAYQVCDSYAGMDEANRVEFLSNEIRNLRPLTAELEFSEETNQTVSLFRKIKEAHQNAGEACVQTYIISMSESVSDILEVLLLMSDASLFGKLDVVPLFETIDDLLAAPAIMSRLFENDVYQKHLEKRGNQQQIMIGYSDSNKDGGFLRANWMLFAAQRNLAETCQKYDVSLTLFHGRGGSIGRGGGPTNRAILAQPPESVRGRIRITEQGEVVSSRYTHDQIAKRHLQQLFHAVLCSSGRRPEFEQLDRWAEIADQISQAAFDKYRSLVENQDFIRYFHAATPIDQIDMLNLGSRPSRRKATESIADLRAIPWVFAWTQSRTNIPSWYGVGTAFKGWIDSDQGTLAELQDMYQNWPFFKTTLGNVHLGMGRADMEIAALYSKLADDESGEAIFENIKSEYDLARQCILEITQHDEILETESWLKHSIKMRNPYVDPLNYIQVALLQRYRNSGDETERAEIQQAIIQSVNGIAAGLQNVG